MKKSVLFLVAILVLSMFAFTACANIPKFDRECAEHIDVDEDYVCDECQKELTPPGPCQHVDENKDHVCDLCEEVVSECADENRDHGCDVCGKTLSECVNADGNHACDVCGKALSECADGDSDHACDVCGEKLSDCIDENGDYACDVCQKEMLPANMERVSYYLNVTDLEATTLDKDLINGKFTIVSGSEIRNRTKTFEGVEYNRSVKIGNKTTMIKIAVPGTGKLSFLVQNGSSGAATQFITVTDPTGAAQDIEFAGTNEGSPVVKITVDVTEGVWTISRGKNGGTQDIFELSLSCVVEKSAENGFEIVDEGTVDYLCGQALDFTSLVLNATYANGKTESISIDDVTIDSSNVNMAASGKYAVTVSYKNYTPITFNVNVYQPESVVLGYDATVLKGQSAAGNGLYLNQSFKEVYAIGETFDVTGLSVMVIGTLGGEEKTFSLGDNYKMSDVDLSSAGAKEITVSYEFGGQSVKAYTTVYVVDQAPSMVEDTYQVMVDGAYTGTIGAVKGGYNMFATVQQALDFLAKADAGKQKVMVIAEGYYREKIEIAIPNLYIKGAGADKVVIEWDSIYGIKDAGGFAQVTDSTQTVAVRDTATNVTIEGVTISNYWNSQERMDEAGLAIERGLALLVQADRFIMKNSALLGIQDTLEVFTGRQYFENVFISGYTDFIFGTNNTTLFKNCTIHVIDTVKDDQGTAGYLTAFKGSNKGAADAITYGAIFSQCKFTADEGVMAGKTAIGRTWGAYAAVAVINCDLGEHISVDGYDKSNNKNKRYISMNGIHPTDETVQFVEYGNTGAGAITEAVAGMKMLTAEEAANYTDIAVIFGKNNRGVTWLDPWDPASTEIVVDDRSYYYFDQTAGTSGQSYTFDTATTITKGTTLEWEGLLISAENGSVAWNSNANALNMKKGAFIKFSVAAGTEVTVITYPSYNYFTLNGVATASSTTLSQYYAEATEVTLLSTGDLYIYQIVINPGEEAPVAPTLNQIKVAGMNVNYIVGESVSLDGVQVLAYYSDNSIVTVTGYDVNLDGVNADAAGEYQVVFTYGGLTANVTVTYEDPNADPAIIKDTYLDFSSADGYNAVTTNPKVTMVGSFRLNGAEYQVKGTVSFLVKAGTTVEVVPYANSNYVSYTLGMEGEENLTVYNEAHAVTFLEDCVAVYTGLDNNYLVGISVKCPVAEGKYVFGGSTEEGDVTGILASGNGINVVGTCKTHSGGAQLGGDSLISFTTPAFATVTIKGFDTSYGQLNVLVDGKAVAMDDKACYVFTAMTAAKVEISAVNVGTEDAPKYNKSYITYMVVDLMDVIAEDMTVTFGSQGNYKDCGVDFSKIQIGDNGGDNSQIKNGYFTIAVKKGATLTVNGYPGYTSYTLGDGTATTEEITEKTYTYTAEANVVITITPVSGNNYFYSITVAY